MAKDIIHTEIKPIVEGLSFPKTIEVKLTMTNIAVVKVLDYLTHKAVIDGLDVIRTNPSDMLSMKIMRAIEKNDENVLVTACDLGES